MGQIKVTSEELRNMATQVRATGETIKQQLDQTLSRVRSVLGETWTGQAASSFDAFYQEANTGWQQVQTAMEGVATMVTSAAEAYDTTETGIAGQFR